MKTTFEVTDLDISQGCMHDCLWCPVARSLTRSGLHFEGVGTYRIVFKTSEYEVVQVDLPKEVSERISTFDSSGRMEPFSFELDVPQAVIDWSKNRPKSRLET